MTLAISCSRTVTLCCKATKLPLNTPCVTRLCKLPTSTQIARSICSTDLLWSYKPKIKQFVNCDYVDNMDFGIYALTSAYVKEAAIESARVAIVRKSKSREVWKVKCEYPFTKKPEGTRMGKGKGKVDHWAAKAEAGQVLFEFNCDNESLAWEAFRQASYRLPVRTHFRIRPKEPRKVLTGSELMNMYAENRDRNDRLGL